MIGPKSKVLPPGYRSNANVTMEGAEEGEEVGGVDSVLRRDWHRAHLPLG